MSGTNLRRKEGASENWPQPWNDYKRRISQAGLQRLLRFLLLFFFPNPGITNYEEYSLIQETVEEKKDEGMGTLKKDRTLLRDERKMEKLKAKLHTDDDCERNHAVDGQFVSRRHTSRLLSPFFTRWLWEVFCEIVIYLFPLLDVSSSDLINRIKRLWLPVVFFLPVNWLDHSRTFREQGVDENETLLLRRKFFYSDQNVDSRDPVQLNLLYVQVCDPRVCVCVCRWELDPTVLRLTGHVSLHFFQARDDILNGSHPVSFDKAGEFGGIQAQIQFGPHVEHKHKPGFLE